MNEEMRNIPIKKELQNMYTQNAHKTCSMFFSWDALFYHTFFVSLYLLIFRLFFTFFFAFMFAQQWHVEKMWGWFPIVAFNSNMDDFTKMNSYAIIVTGAMVLCLFVFHCFAQYQEQRKYKIYAWYTGVLMLLIQYIVLIVINHRIRFSIDTGLGFYFVGFIIIATILLYIWQKHLREWKFKQFIRAEEKRAKKIKSKQKRQ